MEDADLVLGTTNLDEVNMLCALTAKRLGAKFTIARIRDLAYAGRPARPAEGPEHRRGHQP
ncbi:MAG: NAD-binding protein [Evtepia gabavorous]